MRERHTQRERERERGRDKGRERSITHEKVVGKLTNLFVGAESPIVKLTVKRGRVIYYYQVMPSVEYAPKEIKPTQRAVIGNIIKWNLLPLRYYPMPIYFHSEQVGDYYALMLKDIK